MDLTEEVLQRAERDAERAQWIGPGVLAMACSPELVISLVEEVRRLRGSEGWSPRASIIPAIRALQSMRTQIQDIEYHLGDALTEAHPNAESEQSSSLEAHDETAYRSIIQGDERNHMPRK